MSNIVLKKAQVDTLQQVITTAIIIVMIFIFFVGYITTQQQDAVPLQTLLLQQSNRAIQLPEWNCDESNCFEKEKLRMLDETYFSLFGRSKLTLTILHEQHAESLVLYNQLGNTQNEYHKIIRFVQVKEKEEIRPGILSIEARR